MRSNPAGRSGLALTIDDLIDDSPATYPDGSIGTNPATYREGSTGNKPATKNALIGNNGDFKSQRIQYLKTPYNRYSETNKKLRETLAQKKVLRDEEKDSGRTYCEGASDIPVTKMKTGHHQNSDVQPVSASAFVTKMKTSLSTRGQGQNRAPDLSVMAGLDLCPLLANRR